MRLDTSGDQLTSESALAQDRDECLWKQKLDKQDVLHGATYAACR